MALHLIKLCVGVDHVDELAGYQSARLAAARAAGIENPKIRHVTRNTPRRAAQVLDGGSLYWVIRRVIRVRQRILAFEAVEREDGTPACAIVLDPVLVRTKHRSFRPFQGWRYFPDADVPPDLPEGANAAADVPEEMADELRELGLI